MGVHSLGYRDPARSDEEFRGKGGSSLWPRAQSSEKGNRGTARGHLASTGAQGFLLLALSLAQGDSGGPVMCREPDGHWVQVGIISFTSKCAQEDTPVLLTDMAAHSSWLQAYVHGAAFLVQDSGVKKMSDENSCVGRYEHEYQDWGVRGLPVLKTS